MTVRPHRCQQRHQTHLSELKRRRELESLRTPISDLRLFPPDKDPGRSPITVEEIKKLIRAWKLHDKRGFWKTHIEQDDLVHICLRHMENTKYRDLLSINVPAPPPPPKPRRRPPPANQPQDKDGQVKCPLRPYKGDVFGNYQYEGGLLYLSRFDLGKSNKKRGQVRGGRSLFQVLPSMLRASGDSDSEDELSKAAGKQMQQTYETIADQIYYFSLYEGSEHKIVEEGALKVVTKLSKLEILPVAKRCAAAVCNLTMCRESRRGINKAYALEAITHLLTTFAEDDDVMQCCLLSLTALSAEVGQEERVFRDFAAAVPRMNTRLTEQPHIKAACVYTLSNCLDSNVRPYVVVQLLSLLKTLDPANAETRPMLSQIALILSTFEESRHAMVDGGLTGILTSIVNHCVSLKKVEGDNLGVARQVATALCNLSCFSDGRDHMVADGAVRAAVILAGSNLEEESIASCLWTMLNLSSLPHHTPVFLLNRAVTLLTELAFRLTRRDNLLTLVDIMHNLASVTDPPNTLEKMVSQSEAHKALIRLISPVTHGVDRDVELVALRALCTLLTETVNQTPILAAKALSGVLVVCVTQNHDVELLRLCSSILFNFSLHEPFLDAADEAAVLQVLTFAGQSDEALRLTSVRTLTLFCQHPRTCAILAKAGLLSQCKGLITLDDKEILQHCATLLSFLARKLPPSSTTSSNASTPSPPPPSLALVQRSPAQRHLVQVQSRAAMLHDIMELLLVLVQQPNSDTQTLVTCAEAVYGIAQDEDHPDVGLVLRMATTLSQCCKNDAKVVYLVGATVVQLSASQTAKTIVAQDPSILNMLIRMMRGAAAPTQLNSAKALCNLACDTECAKVMIRNKSMEDFVVITVLRATTSVIKEICVSTLFNLLSHEAYREECVRDGILWAIIKISGDCRAAQSLCARAIFNLSFDPQAQTKMVEMGVAKCLALITQQQDTSEQHTRRHCIGVLYNLSFDYADAMLGNQSSEVANPVIHSLGELTSSIDRDLDAQHCCAVIIKNLSESGEEYRRLAVQEGVTKMLTKLAASRHREASVASLLALNNYSSTKECRSLMMDDQVIACLATLLGETTDLTRACLVVACLRDFSFSTGLRKRAVLYPVVDACGRAVSRWAKANLAAAAPREHGMEPTALCFGQMMLRLLSTLSYQTDEATTLRQEGMASTLLTLMEHLPLEPLVALDFATAVSNLSFHAPFLEDLLSVTPGALLRCCLRILRRREDALRAMSPSGMDSTGPRRRGPSAKRSVASDHMAVQDLSMVEEDFAVLLRNISSFPALAQLACKCEELSLVLERLSTPRLYPSPLAVLNNLSVAMFNFFAIPACERFLSARGANNVLLKIGQLEGLPEHIPRLCSLALSKQKHRITQEYQSGSMNALASLLKTTGLEKAVTDIGPVTKPTPPEEFFAYEPRLLLEAPFLLALPPPPAYSEQPDWHMIDYAVHSEAFLFGEYEPATNFAPIRPPHSARTFNYTQGDFLKLSLPQSKYHLPIPPPTPPDIAATSGVNPVNSTLSANNHGSNGNEKRAEHPRASLTSQTVTFSSTVAGNRVLSPVVETSHALSPTPPTTRQGQTRARIGGSLHISINTNAK